MSQENQLLLHDYSGLKNSYQLVLKETENGNRNAEYYVKILEKFSKKEIQRVLEIHPLNEESYQINLRKNGFEVQSLALDMHISGITGEQDGDHYIIGKDFNFPQLKQKFDAVVITHGCVGKFISSAQITNFLNKVFDLLDNKGLLIFEFWHLPGIEREVTDSKGHKDWEKLKSSNEGSILRFSNSKLHLESSVLSVDVHYIINKKGEEQQFNECYAWRLYTIAEIDLLLNNCGFQLQKTFKFPTLEKPEFTSFRLIGIGEKN